MWWVWAIPASVRRKVSIVQHNAWESGMCFLRFFNSLKTGTAIPSFVLLQHPPVCRNRLPSFGGFKAFAPEISNGVPPKVACYVHHRLLQTYPILPGFFECPDWMALDVHSLSALFDSNHLVLRLYNSYSTNRTSSYVRTVTPEKMFEEHDFPCLVAGNFNGHNPLSDPLKEYSAHEVAISTPYFDRAADLGFSLLNKPRVFTHFPFVAADRPAGLDISFVNIAFAPFFSSWLTHLPRTGSDHVPIIISLSDPLLHPSAPSANWKKTKWASLTLPLDQLKVPNPPPLPTMNSLSTWFDWHLATLTSLLAQHTPLKHPSIHSQPWWNDNLSVLCQDLHEGLRFHR